MASKLKKTAGETQNDGALPAGDAPAERFLAIKEGIEVRRGDSVRAAPADGFAPRLGLVCRALHAAQVTQHGEREIVGVCGAFYSVYEAAGQVGHTRHDQTP